MKRGKCINYHVNKWCTIIKAYFKSNGSLLFHEQTKFFVMQGSIYEQFRLDKFEGVSDLDLFQP